MPVPEHETDDLGFRLARWGYTLLLHLLILPVLFHFLWRSRRERGYRRHLAERFLPRQPPAAQPDLWIHAASLGEMRVAGSLVRAIASEHPDLHIQLTTMTPAGRAEAERMQAAGLGVRVRYLPLDLPLPMRSLVRDLKPRILVLVETELWPNLLWECGRQGIPVALINARLSPQRRATYRKLRSLYGPLIARLQVVAAQSETDAEALRDLGALKISVSGNLKFDAPAARPSNLDRTRFHGDWLWLAGSTHPGEETLLLQVHRDLRARHPDRHVQLLLAPRHPSRTAEILLEAGRAGLVAVPRSGIGVAGTAADVVVLDTLGELAGLYLLADAAFVGGSLVDHGGQNPLEPAAAGCPAVTGPDVRNFADSVALLAAANAIRRVDDARGLFETLDQWLRNPQTGKDLAARALGVLAANRGATEHTLERLRPWLHAGS